MRERRVLGHPGKVRFKAANVDQFPLWADIGVGDNKKFYAAAGYLATCIRYMVLRELEYELIFFSVERLDTI